MQHFERCFEELEALKQAFSKQNQELEELRNISAAQNDQSLRTELQKVRQALEKTQSENKALKQSLKLITEKRKQDRATIEKWQQVLKLLPKPSTAPEVSSQTRSDIPTDETRLESSPPRKNCASLYMESIDEGDPEAEFTYEAQVPTTSVEVKIEPDAKKFKPAVTIDELMARDWHPSDFMVNPDFNSGLNHAFHEKVLGKARQHLDCRDCADCNKFQNLTGKKIESRHRQAWEKQSTPPGFWRSGFDTVAENLDRQQVADKTREEALERLKIAIQCGKYLFKDANLRLLAEQGEIG